MTPNTLHHVPRRSVAAAAISISIVLAAGCSSNSESTSSTTQGRSRTTTTRSEEAAVDQTAALDKAVRAFWDLYIELGGNTGPFDPEVTKQRLAERTTGKELNRLLAVFSGNAAAHYVVRGGIEVAPTVVSIDGATAQVRDCYDDTTGLYRIDNGKRVDTDDPKRHQVLMTFVLDGGTWKVSAIADEGTGCHV